MRSEHAGRLTAAVVAGAFLLRIPRAVLRWDEVSLAYAAYAEPAVLAIEGASVSGAAAAWVGLHPPLHALLLGLSEVFLPIPALWLMGSVLASTIAVWAACRVAGPVGGLALATAPLQLAYAAEVNNYPLAVGSIGVLLVAGRARWGWLVAAVALASFSHLMGAAAAGGVVLWRLVRPLESGERPRLALGALLVALPVLVGALRLMGQDTTFIQPEAEAGTWLSSAAEALGPVGLALAAVGLMGLRGPALAAFVPAALLLAISLSASAAAPHQLPYLALLGVPLAVGLPEGLRMLGRGARWAQVLALGAMLWSGAGEFARSGSGMAALASAQDEARGVDAAFDGASAGDVVWLVAPALQVDDDKTDTSAVLWRMPPWKSMPRAGWVLFEYRDWRYGQPRLTDGRAVHTSTELHEAAFDHVARHALAEGGTVWVVLYDHAPATGLEERVERALRPYVRVRNTIPTSRGLGDDIVWQVTGLAQ